MYQRSTFRILTSRQGDPAVSSTTPEDNEKQSHEADPSREDATADAVEQGMEMDGVYVISVAARLLDMHPQTLRKYERLGLINPGRSIGMLRLYSREDIRKVMLIRHLMDNLGLNLAGVEFVLNLVENLFGMKQFLEEAAAGNPLQPAIGQAINQLFHNLNLPVEA